MDEHGTGGLGWGPRAKIVATHPLVQKSTTANALRFVLHVCDCPLPSLINFIKSASPKSCEVFDDA